MGCHGGSDTLPTRGRRSLFSSAARGLLRVGLRLVFWFYCPGRTLVTLGVLAVACGPHPAHFPAGRPGVDSGASAGQPRGRAN